MEGARGMIDGEWLELSTRCAVCCKTYPPLEKRSSHKHPRHGRSGQVSYCTNCLNKRRNTPIPFKEWWPEWRREAKYG